jgi:hypothetical protein
MLTGYATLDIHVGEVLEVEGRHGPEIAVRHVERVGDLSGVEAAKSSGRLMSIVQEADFVDLVELARLRRDVCQVRDRQLTARRRTAPRREFEEVVVRETGNSAQEE